MAAGITGLDSRAALWFAGVGASATLLYLGLALAGSWSGLPASLSSLVAYAVAALWSYAGHRWLTFRSDAPASQTAPRFAALTAAQYLIALAVPAVLADYAGWRADIAYLVVCVLVPLSSLALMPRLVFTNGNTQTSWTLPTITDTTAWCVTLGAMFAVLCIAVGPQLLADPDTQWHIATGRWMIENGAMLRRDVFSHTFDGHPWIAKEWLSQLLLAAAYMTGGWNGTALLTAVAFASTVGIVARQVSDRAGIAGGIAAAFLLFWAVAPTLVARPHVLVFPVVAAWTVLLLRASERTGEPGSGPPWLALPLLVLWANLHAGFTIGLVIAGAFGIEALLRAKPETRMTTAWRWFAFGVASLAACLATPHGAAPLMLNAQMASGNEAMQFIKEWRGFELSMRWMLLGALVATSIGTLMTAPRENAGRILLIAALAMLTFKHVRFAMILGIVVPIAAGPALWQAAKTLSRRLGLFQETIGLASGVTPGRVLAAVVVLAVSLLAIRPLAPPQTSAPTAALASVPSELRARPAFNSYDFGGFLAFQGVKTFIDGRTDQLFLGGFMTRMMAAASAREPRPMATLLDEHRIDWAIIGARTPETQVFPQLEGWQLHYRDAAAQVWIRQR